MSLQHLNGWNRCGGLMFGAMVQAGGGRGEVRERGGVRGAGKHFEIQTSRHPDIQRSRNPDIQTSKKREPEIHKSRDPQIQRSRNPDFQTSTHNYIYIKPIEYIPTKATQNTPPPCRKHGPFWTRHKFGGFSWDPLVVPLG